MELVIYVARQFGIKECFCDEVASAKLNLHGELFRNYGHLGLFEAKHTCVIHGLARYSFFCFRSKRVDRCVGVEHEEYLEAADLTSYVGTIPTWLVKISTSWVLFVLVSM